MPLARRAFILGGSITPFIGKRHPDFIDKRHPDFGKRANPTLEEYITTAVRGTLDATGVAAADVERLWIGNFVGELFSSQGHLGAAVIGAHPDLAYKPAMRVEGACASGGLALSCAVDAVQAGVDVALVCGAEVQTTVSPRIGGDYLARAAHYRRERAIDDFTFPALFARRAKHYYEAYPDAKEQDLARVVVKAYANANRNPLAHMHAAKMELGFASEPSDRNPCFLANEDLAPFMKVTDCSQVSDGASALILVSEDGLRRLGKTPDDAVELMTLTHSTASLYEDADPTRLLTVENAARKAYAAAGIQPANVDVAEVHDCFSITEVMMYEALGFADPGRGVTLAREGRTCIDGDIPVNTGGGLIGFGHPVGATGVKQVLEVARQIRGECGAYQIGGSPTVGLTANMGGNDKTVVVTVLRG